MFRLALFALVLQPINTQLSLEAQEELARASGNIEIRYCMSCGYKKAYDDYARALHSQFPRAKVRGEFYNPGEAKMMLAQVLQMTFFGGLAVSLIGRSLLPEPYSKFIETNQMMILGGCFLCNIISGNLLNSGAFEVAYNGQPVWSKIESGRFPQMPELLDALKAVMQGAALPSASQESLNALPDEL